MKKVALALIILIASYVLWVILIRPKPPTPVEVEKIDSTDRVKIENEIKSNKPYIDSLHNSIYDTISNNERAEYLKRVINSINRHRDTLRKD